MQAAELHAARLQAAWALVTGLKAAERRAARL